MLEKNSGTLTSTGFVLRLIFGKWRAFDRSQTCDCSRVRLDVQDVRKVSLQCQNFITKTNEKTDEWILLQNETYIFKFFFKFYGDRDSVR